MKDGPLAISCPSSRGSATVSSDSAVCQSCLPAALGYTMVVIRVCYKLAKGFGVDPAEDQKQIQA